MTEEASCLRWHNDSLIERARHPGHSNHRFTINYRLTKLQRSHMNGLNQCTWQSLKLSETTPYLSPHLRVRISLQPVIFCTVFISHVTNSFLNENRSNNPYIGELLSERYKNLPFYPQFVHFKKISFSIEIQ